MESLAGGELGNKIDILISFDILALVLPRSCAAADYNGDQPGVSWTPRVLMQCPLETSETQVPDNESESN